MNQCADLRWYSERSKRITASVFGQVINRRLTIHPTSLIKVSYTEKNMLHRKCQYNYSGVLIMKKMLHCSIKIRYKIKKMLISFLSVCMVNTIYLFSFLETPRKFIIAELSIRKLGSSSVQIIL